MFMEHALKHGDTYFVLYVLHKIINHLKKIRQNLVKRTIHQSAQNCIIKKNR